ncbi:MAG: S41 family peptidase [Phycisphaerales bacterium]
MKSSTRRSTHTPTQSTHQLTPAQAIALPHSKLLHQTILKAVLGTAIGLSAFTSNAAVLADSPNDQHSTLQASSSLVWDLATQGSDSGINTLLTPEAWGTSTDPTFTASLTLLQENLAKQQQTRAESIEESTETLEEHLALFKESGSPIELSKGLIAAVSLQLLSPSDDEFHKIPGVKTIIDQSIKHAKLAELNGDWLIASELFYRLNAIYDQAGTFREDVDRLTRRLTMIRMYVPERLWELRNERRLAEDLEGLPPYNPFGDRYTDKLQGIDSVTVRTAIQRAAAQHLDRQSKSDPDGVSLNDLIVGGLDAVRTMATTTDLSGAFPKFANNSTRSKFVSSIDNLKLKYASDARPANAYDLRRAIDSMMSASRDSVGVMPEALLHEFGNGAIAQLDAYTAIIWPDEVARFRRSTQGEFIGVGIRIQLDELQNITIVTPLEGTPAQRAGLQADDIIKKVDGISAVGLGLDQAVEVITGPPNTTVDLTVERSIEDSDGNTTLKEFEYTITRAKIDLPSVKGWSKTGPGDEDWNYFLDEDQGIGYVRLTGFTQDTTKDFDRAVAKMKDQGLSALILDLRYNPGGLLDQAVQMSSRFVPQGMVVRTVDASGNTQDRQDVRPVNPKYSLRDLPCVVLVNEGSASASEIVSGAIQAGAHQGKNKALVVGARSFGKGSVQNVYMLPGGLSAMKITTQHYEVDSPRMIHKVPGATEWGIEPDLHVEMLPTQQAEAVMLRRDSDIYPIDKDGFVIEDPDRPTPQDLITKGIDLQVQTALVLLQSQVDEAITKTSMSD